MKAILFGFLLLSTLGFSVASYYEVRKNTAEVDQLQGFYVFVDCRPVGEYEYLGTVKKSVSWSGQYQSVRDGILKKARKDFPQGDGVIFTFQNGGADRVDVIKFK